MPNEKTNTSPLSQDLRAVAKALDALRDKIHVSEMREVDNAVIKGNALAAALSSAIDDDQDKLSAAASAGGISESTMRQILNGSINCPPAERIAGFSRALGVSVSRLEAAMRRDGCPMPDD